MLVSVKNYTSRTDYNRQYNLSYNKLPNVIQKRRLRYKTNKTRSSALQKIRYEINKPRLNEISRQYYRDNKVRLLKQAQVKNQKVKIIVMRHYSVSIPACKCCGETLTDFLTIDHINGGGSKQGKAGASLYVWLRKNGYPEGFQVLCFNCNCGRALKQNNNICPHKRKNGS